MKSVGEFLVNIYSLLKKDTQEKSFSPSLDSVVFGRDAWAGWSCLAMVPRMKSHTEEGIAEGNAESWT